MSPNPPESRDVGVLFTCKWSTMGVHEGEITPNSHPPMPDYLLNRTIFRSDFAQSSPNNNSRILHISTFFFFLLLIRSNKNRRRSERGGDEEDKSVSQSVRSAVMAVSK